MKKEIELQKMVVPLIEWFQKEKRDLPWRKTNDSYKIWISEIMLQQTRVETVKEYYKHFLSELPTLHDLAKVKDDKLLKLWEGLGYYSRAKNLKKCAIEIAEKGLQELPRDYEELKKLPGIGPYAAGSIGSIAYNLKTPAIDGNVLRVMTRLLEDERDIMKSSIRKEYFQILQQIMPENTRDFTESLMELGALICLPNGIPKCQECPISFLCQSYSHQSMLNYPNKKKELQRKIEQKTIIILEYNQKFALQKRPEQGLLASLYEFYNVSGKLTKKELKEQLKKDKIEYAEVIALNESKHIFSHLEWEMIGYFVHCKKRPKKQFVWASKEEIKNKYSLPNAYSKYIKQIHM